MNTEQSSSRTRTERMKLAFFTWVAAAACLVARVVFSQPTTGKDNCSSSVDASSSVDELRNLARRTNEMVQQVLKEVRKPVVKTDCQTSPQHISSNAAALLQNNCIPLLVQQHINGSNVFNRSWEEFKVGFNDTKGNFWLGNELLHQLTSSGIYKLRFELLSRAISTYIWIWVEYGTFVVANEATKYMMHTGPFSGEWEDALKWHNGARFTTYDSDNDGDATQNCAVATGGGFWWDICRYCGVNTPLGSSTDFRWLSDSHYRRLAISRMWLTC